MRAPAWVVIGDDGTGMADSHNNLFCRNFSLMDSDQSLGNQDRTDRQPAEITKLQLLRLLGAWGCHNNRGHDWHLMNRTGCHSPYSV